MTEHKNDQATFTSPTQIGSKVGSLVNSDAVGIFGTGGQQGARRVDLDGMNSRLLSVMGQTVLTTLERWDLVHELRVDIVHHQLRIKVRK